MSYSDIIQYDIKTKRNVRVPVTNEWILSNKSHTLLLSVSSDKIVADGKDTIVLNVQLQTPELLDGSKLNLSQNITVRLLIDDEPIDIQLTDGFFSDIITCVNAGIFSIQGFDYPSNVLEIEGI